MPLFQVRWPSAIEGLRRLDRKSLLPHRPATAIADRMAPEAGDQFAVALWRAHLERALRAAPSLKAGKPIPQVAARDPYALRGLVPFWRWRPSLPPAAIAPNASPPHSIGTAS